MIKSVRIVGFKCFDDLSLSIAPLTVLCGKNSGGKSTIVQALLLHDLVSSTYESYVPLNGPFGLALGESDSLINKSSSRDIEDGFIIEVNGNVLTYTPGQSPRVMTVSGLAVRPQGKVHFLSAERTGPRLSQERFFNDGLEVINVGPSGEYTAQVISAKERDKVRLELVPPGWETALFIPVLEHYMGSVFGPIEIQVRANGNTPPSLYFKKPGVEEDWHLSSHTGFGLTYTLPIIVAGLTLKPGDTLVVDSPEAHLHPAAQTAIARFLSKVAGSGVGVIIETHSDYVVEGVRISVASDNSINSKDCVVLSLGDESETGGRVTPLEILPNGKIENWPKGFFDQHIINMRSLILPRSG